MINVMNFIYILSGAYLTYAGVVMKTQGKIVENVVLSKGIDEKAIRDKEGFIQYLHIRLVVIGIVIILTGIVNFISDYMGGGSGIMGWVTFVIFGAALVAYAKVTSKALKKYTR